MPSCRGGRHICIAGNGRIHRLRQAPASKEESKNVTSHDTTPTPATTDRCAAPLVAICCGTHTRRRTYGQLRGGSGMEHSAHGDRGDPPNPSVVQMTFSYTAAVLPSAAYDGYGTAAGIPQTCRQLRRPLRLPGASGSLTVTAELSAQGGWRSSVPLIPATAFAGKWYEGSAHLDLKPTTGTLPRVEPRPVLVVGRCIDARLAPGSQIDPRTHR